MLSYKLHSFFVKVYFVYSIIKESIFNKLKSIENTFLNNINLVIVYCFIILPILSLILLFISVAIIVMPISFIMGWI